MSSFDRKRHQEAAAVDEALGEAARCPSWADYLACLEEALVRELQDWQEV